MGFSRQEYWSGLLFPSPWDLPDLRDRTQGLNPHLLHWQLDLHWATWEAPYFGSPESWTTREVPRRFFFNPKSTVLYYEYLLQGKSLNIFMASLWWTDVKLQYVYTYVSNTKSCFYHKHFVSCCKSSILLLLCLLQLWRRTLVLTEWSNVHCRTFISIIQT